MSNSTKICNYTGIWAIDPWAHNSSIPVVGGGFILEMDTLSPYVELPNVSDYLLSVDDHRILTSNIDTVVSIHSFKLLISALFPSIGLQETEDNYHQGHEAVLKIVVMVERCDEP